MPAPNQVKLVRWEELLNHTFISSYSSQGIGNTSKDRYARVS
ncbi:hypothetical protein [Aerosakkonema funiforme]